MNSPDANPNGARTPTSAASVAPVASDVQTTSPSNAAPAADVGVRAPKATALDWRATLGWGTVAIACFHLAFLFPPLAFLIAVYLLAVFRLSEVATPRRALLAWLTFAALRHRKPAFPRAY